MVNFAKRKVVHTYSSPGKDLYEAYKKAGYQNVGQFYGFNSGVNVSKPYKMSNVEKTFLRKKLGPPNTNSGVDGI